MNTQNTEVKQFGTKEYLKEKLLGLDKIYCVYLDTNGFRMQFYYMDVDREGKPTLEKVWISPDFETRKLPKDIPSYWGKAAKSDSYAYCFKVHAYGTSRSWEAVTSLYYWLGEYDLSKMPRVETLN